VKMMHAEPGVSRIDGILRAVRTIAGDPGVRLNFVMTEGDTLFAPATRRTTAPIPSATIRRTLDLLLLGCRVHRDGIGPGQLGTIPAEPGDLHAKADWSSSPWTPNGTGLGEGVHRAARIGRAWPNPTRDAASIAALLPPDGER
jgi:hypothetical protein